MPAGALRAIAGSTETLLKWCVLGIWGASDVPRSTPPAHLPPRADAHLNNGARDPRISNATVL